MSKTEFLGKSISGPFTIPSGIVATATPIIQYIFDNVPQVGVMTTKSIGPVPRPGNREPIMTQYAPGCFMNAVGLTNPGAEEMAQQLTELSVPEDRFLLTSIFGGSVEEIVAVAELLAPCSDGLELNLSCPHAKGYGMDMGQDADMVREITAAVKAVVNIPVVPKLTPNVPNIGEIAAAAVEGGADALCAINTVGPAYYTAHGEPVLTNKVGGMSGKGVLPIALKCIREVREAVDVPIIGCGGISSADDVRAFEHEGASVFGVGSALTGLNSVQIGSYFEELSADLASDTNQAGANARYDVDMGFEPYTLVKNDQVCEDITVLTFDRKLDVKAGEFIYTWIPGLGEKPFSALTDDPFSIVVIDVGIFTSELMTLEPPALPSTSGVPTAMRCSHPPTRKSCASPAAPDWPRCTRSQETLETRRFSSARDQQNGFTFVMSVQKSPPCTWRLTMAVRGFMALSPNCWKRDYRSSVTQNGKSWSSTTVAPRPWCTLQRRSSRSSYQQIAYSAPLIT